MPGTNLYEKDYYAWANDTAEAIRTGEFGKIDREALADEVADIARKEKRSLRSRLEVLIAHLLNWDHQEHKRTRSWATTIDLQRGRVSQLLTDSPSLQPWLDQNMEAIYSTAVKLAMRDTDLVREVFPESCPFSLDEILTTKRIEY